MDETISKAKFYGKVGLVVLSVFCISFNADLVRKIGVSFSSLWTATDFLFPVVACTIPFLVLEDFGHRIFDFAVERTNDIDRFYSTLIEYNMGSFVANVTMYISAYFELKLLI